MASNSVRAAAVSFLGAVPACASVSHSAFEEFVDARMASGRQRSTQDEAEAALRHGERPDWKGFTPWERIEVTKAARQPVPVIRFKRLSIDEKLNAYDLATPEEREQFHLRRLIFNTRINWPELAPEQRRDLHARLQRLRGQQAMH